MIMSGFVDVINLFVSLNENRSVSFLVDVINSVTFFDFSKFLDTADPTNLLLPTTSTLIFYLLINTFIMLDILFIKVNC